MYALCYLTLKDAPNRSCSYHRSADIIDMGAPCKTISQHLFVTRKHDMFTAFKLSLVLLPCFLYKRQSAYAIPLCSDQKYMQVDVTT